MGVVSIVLPCVMLLLMGCEERTQETEIDTLASEPVLEQDPVRYTRGLKLYQQNCAACHGKQGEGALNWQQRDANGQYRPPPLNGSGHTWHHPMSVLVDIINNGTQRLGGNMPPWKGKLSNEETQDILFWVQSQWRNEIYAAWYKNNQEIIRNRSSDR